MKKILSIIAMLSLALTMTACTTQSQKPADTASDLETIRENGALKIGYTIINPLNYFDDNNNLIGFETDFASAVCEKIGVTPEFIEINWDSKEVELNSKNIDCIWNGMTITPERQESMSISIPYLENRQVIVAKAENADAYTESLEGVKVIAEGGSAGEELATSDEFFANAEYTAVDSQATALMDVASGTSGATVIDYVMAASSVGENTSFSNLSLIDKGFESEQYGVACRKNSDLTDAINTAMQELAADGTLAKIAEKYGLADLLLVK
ncbi:MAG: transporter substrate-binding domain-containing protein [Clostridia bacterium]|nr:transporter substrate-binding domain-containing protein [Clostridia bacterium]